MRKYKIGEVSKILNIPVESIRFFERKGIVTPQKDKTNNYRYYTVNDINRLLDYRKYREFGCSVNEALDIIQSSDLAIFKKIIQDKQAEAEREARLYELKAIKLNNHIKVLKDMPLLMNEYRIVTRPACYYYINRHYNGDEIQFIKSQNEELEQCIKNYTFVENVYCVKKDWYSEERRKEEFQWGFTIKKRWADALELPILPEMEYAPERKALYTFIKANNQLLFSPKLLEPALEYMSRQNYKLVGDIWGVLIATVQEEGEEIRYLEVWIPIE